MEVLSFRWQAKYGHFLRAEANASALTYPVPPRTAVLGLLGAILGLEKDQLPEALKDARVSVSGSNDRRFWHRVKLRKVSPPALRVKVVRSAGRRSLERGEERATLILQEWLLEPDFLVHVALPEQPSRFRELADRVRDRRWHFSPCMGLSEMLADVSFESVLEAHRLPEGPLEVYGLCPAQQVTLRAGDDLGVHLLRLPHDVTPDRTFSHMAYYLEHRSRPIPVATRHAWGLGSRTILFT